MLCENEKCGTFVQSGVRSEVYALCVLARVKFRRDPPGDTAPSSTPRMESWVIAYHDHDTHPIWELG